MVKDANQAAEDERQGRIAAQQASEQEFLKLQAKHEALIEAAKEAARKAAETEEDARQSEEESRIARNQLAVAEAMKQLSEQNSQEVTEGLQRRLEEAD